ncbi:site-specific DNA-methyltransferase [Agrobacterium vitis]|uniref:Methyltransferase n=1 Tax=Agrobacterium vitis TaxID=373 RepID=A0ABD6G6B4_AGRVI|nr:site-specific DNA-methyltransferase [Agrobacterium vitis]MUO77647.1 site-specific DNA-methyltransferase [Agrobacterium vitis]MUO93164.1 site-specific DNA-methyltransferase [Agrobacterium vitis]MUP04515.1 site-specific DNA-methyltransferase [Agrobacterium vitis]MUZ81047.1 site-specific DNA-methyltransferase [Agrobacterium vitis]MVA08767.1 site-specific DNA-methyltransferase [Agrobacterium vitis]
MITFLDGRVTLYPGDCLEVLRTITSDSIDCVVTSPPYWGLRDYGVEGQIGLEPTLAEHLAVMVGVFDEVRRVLKPTGTCWINYGDCYAAAPNGRSAADTKTAGNDDRTFRDKPFSTVGGGIKAKDLCMIPNRLAIALQDAGWWVRSEIIWGKTNPMPDSSGAYRPSTAHEKIFMLTKTADGDVWRARDTGEVSFFPDLSERCGLVTDPKRDGARWLRIGSFYDAEVVKQGGAPGLTGNEHNRHSLGQAIPENQRRAPSKIKMPDGWESGEGAHGSRHRRGRESGKILEVTPRHQGQINHTGLDELGRGNGRYLRNYEPAPLTVWEMATQAFSEAHFATFPTELAERCILAGCPKGGLVLDPFGGAGTTALVALRHGRNAALIELNAEYAEIAKSRIEDEWRVQRKRKDPIGVLPLFVEAAQ